MSLSATAKTVSSVVEETIRLGVRILAPMESLTTIQRDVSRASLKAELQAEGVRYEIYPRSADGGPAMMLFHYSTLVVADTATVADVRGDGLFPIHLTADTHTYILFEPRPLSDAELRLERWRRVTNGKYSDLAKGQAFRFRGRVTYCRYQFELQPTARFEFGIVAAGSDDDGRPGIMGRLFRSL